MAKVVKSQMYLEVILCVCGKVVIHCSSYTCHIAPSDHSLHLLSTLLYQMLVLGAPRPWVYSYAVLTQAPFPFHLLAWITNHVGFPDVWA